jgi:hypothetical protein
MDEQGVARLRAVAMVMTVCGKQLREVPNSDAHVQLGLEFANLAVRVYGLYPQTGTESAEFKRGFATVAKQLLVPVQGLRGTADVTCAGKLITEVQEMK